MKILKAGFALLFLCPIGNELYNSLNNYLGRCPLRKTRHPNASLRATLVQNLLAFCTPILAERQKDKAHLVLLPFNLIGAD